MCLNSFDLNLFASKMTTEEKFNAAVNVIRSLPKNGKVNVINTITHYVYINIERKKVKLIDGVSFYFLL